jgi:hypothetical protein
MRRRWAWFGCFHQAVLPIDGISGGWRIAVTDVFRNHHRWPWIGFLNFATGWTVVGWIAALVWCCVIGRGD